MNKMNWLFLFTLVFIISNESKTINLQNPNLKKAIIYTPSIIGGTVALYNTIKAFKLLYKNLMKEHREETIALNPTNPGLDPQIGYVCPKIKSGRFPHLAKYYDERDNSCAKASIIFLCSCTMSIILNKFLSK